MDKVEIDVDAGAVVLYTPTHCGPETYPRRIYPSHWRREMTITPAEARALARLLARAADGAEGLPVADAYVIAAEYDR